MPNRELMTWQAATHHMRKVTKPRKKIGVRMERNAVKVSDRCVTVALMSSMPSSSSSSSRPLWGMEAAVGITSAGVIPGVSSALPPQEKSPARFVNIYILSLNVAEKGSFLKKALLIRFYWHKNLTFTVNVSNISLSCNCKYLKVTL